MKTVKNLLCVVLCFLMAFSPLSVVAFAEGETAEPEYTYSLKHETMSTDAELAKITLDAIDELLAEQNIKFELMAGVAVDLTSVNGLCQTLDLIKSVRAALLLCGDLSELNLRVWEDGMSRPADDVKILNELLELIGTTETKVGQDNPNPAVIAGLVDGDADLGVINSFLDINDLLGEGGISGLLKGILFGLVAEEGTAEYNSIVATYTNDIDGFVYGPLLTKYAGEYLNGFTMTKDTTVEVLISSLFNALIENYVLEWVGGINIDLTAQGNDDLAKLAGVINLDGSTYNLEGIALDPEVGLLEQANDLVGKIFAQIVRGFEWETGDYTKISANIENLFKYIGTESGLIPDAATMTRDEIVMEIVAIILRNVDIGAYGVGITECTTLKDMAKVALVNTARELGITYTYDADDDYLVVLGDILAVWAYDNFNIKDTSGNAYRGGKGHSVWTAANYFLNYFLFDKGCAELFNLDVKATDSIFKKIDEVADLFGASGEVNFDSKTFINDLLDSAFSLDIQNILEITAVPALNTAGRVEAVEFVYNTLRYLINNWTDKSAVPAYTDNGKAFTNLLTNANIAKLLEKLLMTLGERRESLVTVAVFVAGLILDKSADVDLGTPTVTVANCTYTGKVVSPKATVKLGGKTLTQGTDYVVITDGKDIGTATATIRFIGEYKGEDVTANYSINLGKLSGLTATASGTTITLKWTALAGAEKYIITVGGKDYEVAGTKTSYSFKSLKNATKYSYTVKAVAGSQSSSATVSATTAPAQVKGLKISDVKATTLKLSWTKVTGAKGYYIERSTDGKKWTKVATTTSNSYTVKSLTSYTKYYFRVKAYVVNGSTNTYGTVSSSVNTRTALGVVDVTATTTATTVKLSWDKVNGAKNYRIEKYNGKKWVKVTETTKTSYTFSKLKNATKYQYRVRAQVSSKVYSAYDTVTAYTKLTKVSGLKASSVTETSVKLSWTKKSGATGYTIYKSTDGKKWTKVGTAKSSATSYTVKGLVFGTSYKFKVIANTKTTTSEDAIVSAKTSAGKVAGLKATSANRSSVTLSWTAKTGAKSYEVQYSKDGKTWTTVKATKNSATVTGLTRNTSYKFRVRAVNSTSGKSGYSSVVTKKTTLL